MEALLQSLIAKYGYPYAAKLLGIDKQQGNPKYAISLGGNTFNLGNVAKRAGLNQGIKSLMGGKLGGMLGPGLLMGGALMLGRAFNPTRPGSRNYNPELQGQIDYASGKGLIGINSGTGLEQYNTNSVLSGQNVQSLFGTNDYAKQLQNHIDKYGDKDGKGQAELEDLTTAEWDEVDAFMETQNNNDGGGGGTNNTQHGSSGMSKSQHSAFRAARGGIASL